MTQIPQLPPHIDVEDDDLLVVRQSDNKDHKVPVSALSKGNVRYVQTIDDLRAVNGMQPGQAVEVVSTGRAGLFRWSSADLSAEVAADPMSGIYVAPTGQDGSAGAWVRVPRSQYVNPEWWGAERGGDTNSGPAIQSAIDYGPTLLPPGSWYTDDALVYKSGTVLIGAGTRDTVIYSRVVADSTFKSAADVSQAFFSSFSLIGNGVSGDGGNGHAFNMLDESPSAGAWSPQMMHIDQVLIRGFRGRDLRSKNSTDRIDSAGIACHQGLGNTFSRLIIADCGHGFFMYQTQNCRLNDCVVDGAAKYAVLAVDNENLLVRGGDYINSGDGVQGEGYPASSDPYYTGNIGSFNNRGFVLSGSKTKGSQGRACVVIGRSYGDLVVGNLIRADRPQVGSDTSCGVFAVSSVGLELRGNTFDPARTTALAGITSVIIYHDRATELQFSVVDNLFRDAPGMHVLGNVIVEGSSVASRPVVCTVASNTFGTPAAVSQANTYEADIVFKNVTVKRSRVCGNTHFASTNVVRESLVKFDGSVSVVETVIDSPEAALYGPGAVVSIFSGGAYPTYIKSKSIAVTLPTIPGNGFHSFDIPLNWAKHGVGLHASASFNSDIEAVMSSAQIAEDDLIKVNLFNPTSSPIDLGSIGVTVSVRN